MEYSFLLEELNELKKLLGVDYDVFESQQHSQNFAVFLIDFIIFRTSIIYQK